MSGTLDKLPEDGLIPGVDPGPFTRFASVREGERFRFPRSREVLVREAGRWYRDGRGHRWSTGARVLVVVCNREPPT